jgi:nucleotide-binding universal stress UspA family protein
MSPYRTLVVGIEFSLLDEVALNAAAAIAQRANTARIHLVHVLEMLAAVPLLPFDYSGVGFDAMWSAALEGAKGRLASLEPPRTRAAITREVRVGPPSRELAAAADDVAADLIVVASHDRRTLRRIALGSVASSLLRTSARPIIVVGKDRPVSKPIEQILAAIDLSPVSKDVLMHATNMARLSRGSITALSLYDSRFLAPELERMLFPTVRAEIDSLADAYKARVEAIVSEVRDPEIETKVEVMSKAPAHNAILDVAGLLSCDLIVIGTSGHNAWHRFFLGSTAMHVVTEAPCPVLAIPYHEVEAGEEPRAAPVLEASTPRKKAS